MNGEFGERERESREWVREERKVKIENPRSTQSDRKGQLEVSGEVFSESESTSDCAR